MTSEFGSRDGQSLQNPIFLGFSCRVALTHTKPRGCLWLRHPTCQKADPPEPRVQGQLDLGRLVLGLHDALLQVEPVVGADGDAQEAEAADGEHGAEQGQRLPAAGAHRHQHRAPAGPRGEPGPRSLRGLELCLGLPQLKGAIQTINNGRRI